MADWPGASLRRPPAPVSPTSICLSERTFSGQLELQFVLDRGPPRVIRESEVQNLRHIPDQVYLQLGPDLRGDVLQKLALVLPGEDHRREPCPVSGQDLLLDATDRQD